MKTLILIVATLASVSVASALPTHKGSGHGSNGGNAGGYSHGQGSPNAGSGFPH